MTAEPQPGCPEGDLAAAQNRIQQLEDQLCEAEQELQAASDIIGEQEIEIECLRIQLEASDLTIDEAATARRKLVQRIADLEDKPCPVPVPQEQPHQPPHPPKRRWWVFWR